MTVIVFYHTSFVLSLQHLGQMETQLWTVSLSPVSFTVGLFFNHLDLDYGATLSVQPDGLQFSGRGGRTLEKAA